MAEGASSAEVHDMATSPLLDFDEVPVRLSRLERRDANIERRLFDILTGHAQPGDELSEQLIAELQKQHLDLRLEICTTHARIVLTHATP